MSGSVKIDVIINKEAKQSKIAYLLEEIPGTLEWTAPEKISDLVKVIIGLKAIKVSYEQNLMAYYDPNEKTICLSFKILEVLWSQSYGHHLFYKQKLAGVNSIGQNIKLIDSKDLYNAMKFIKWGTVQMKGGNSAVWPCCIQTMVEPKPKAEMVADQQSMVALAFIIHHELGHHRLRHYGQNIEQEKDADAVAADWLLFDYKPNESKHFARAIGVAEALLMITCYGIHTGHHGGESHPPGYQRLLNCLDPHISEDNEDVWAFVSLMLELHMQATGQKIPEQEKCNFRERCDVLIDELSKS